jgi:hypothetical protein
MGRPGVKAPPGPHSGPGGSGWVAVPKWGALDYVVSPTARSAGTASRLTIHALR